MSNSSDSEFELRQQTQARSKMTTSSQESKSKAKSPWDMMKSKQNKAFSKSYLQEMMNLNEPNAEVLKSIEVSNKKQPSDNKLVKDPDQKSPGISKRVSFNEHVQKREIKIDSSSSSGSSEDDEKVVKKPERKGILKQENIEFEDSETTSDDGSIQEQARKINQKRYQGQGSLNEELKKNSTLSKEKSKFTVVRKKNEENVAFNKINNKNVKLKKEKINYASKEFISDSDDLNKNSESSGNEFIQTPNINKMIQIKKEKISSQSDSEIGTTNIPNKKLKLAKNIKKESSVSDSKSVNNLKMQQNSMSESSSGSENENLNVKKSPTRKVANNTTNESSEIDSETEMIKKKDYDDDDEGPSKNLEENESSESSSSDDELNQSKNVSNKIINFQKNIKNKSSDDDDDDEEENMSTNKSRNSSSSVLSKNVNENESSESDTENETITKNVGLNKNNDDDEEEENVNNNKSSSKTKNLENNSNRISLPKTTKQSNKILKLQKRIKNEYSESESEKETIGNVSTLAKICALNTNLDQHSGINDDDNFEKPKNEFLLKKLNNFVEINNLSKIDSKTFNLSKEIKKNEDEIFLARIPKDLDPKHLISGVINFEGDSSSFEINENVYTINVNANKNITNVLIDSSQKDDSFNILSLKSKGLISICKDNKIRRRSLKIKKQDNELIEEPKNLKEQHLLLGHDYEDRINLDKWISDKLEGLITDFNKKQKQKRKKKSIEKRKSIVENQEENLDIFKLLDEHTKKKSSLFEETEIPKIKTEMEESIDIINQMMMENDEVDETNLKKRGKKSRTKSEQEDDVSLMKRKRSQSFTMTNPEDETILDDSSNKSKKNKKSKPLKSERIVKDEMLSEDEFSFKKNKKKIFVNSTMLSVKDDTFGHEESVISQANDSSLNSFINGLVKEVDDKKKKRKRNSLGDVTGMSVDLKKKKKSL